MILFKSDWLRYPSAIVDYKTTNETALRLVYLYKKMGVVNCEFPLALYQPELIGVDPFDPALDAEFKKRIYFEARYNPWYFFREIARLPAKGGNQPIRFRLNRGNIGLYWSYFNHIATALIQIRQTGKSASADILQHYLLDVKMNNSKIRLVTKDTGLRNENVQRMKEIRAATPEYIHYTANDDVDNSEVLTNKRKNTIYGTSIARNDKVAADKLGRGMTVPNIQFDEFAYLPLIDISLPVALASTTAACEEVAKLGGDEPYGVMYTTTTGDLTTRSGKYSYGIISGGYTWSEKLFDSASREELIRVVSRGSKGGNPLINITLNHAQLGYTDDWLADRIRQSRAEGDILHRDWFNVWTQGGEGTPLTDAEKTRLTKSKQEPEHIEITDNFYTLRWYIPENEIEEYMNHYPCVIGLDTSDGLSTDNDAIGFVVTNLYAAETVCTGRFNETNLTQFATFLGEFLVKYKRTVLMPERRSSGTAIMDTVFIHLHINGEDPFKRIFNRIVDEQEQKTNDFKAIQEPVARRGNYFYNQYKKWFGFATSGTGRFSRDGLYGGLKSALKIGGGSVKDEQIINEILALKIKNGRLDHEDGAHDDMVISWLLCHWFATNAFHLDYYGIDSTRVFSTQVITNEDQDVETTYAIQQANEKKNRLFDLVKEIEDEKNPNQIMLLESKIKKLKKSVELDEEYSTSLDALIQNVKKKQQLESTTRSHGSGSVYDKILTALRR